MSRKRYEDLTPRARRRLLTAALLRSGVSVALLLAVYYRAPLDRSLDPRTWIEFLIGLLAFGAVLAWQVRAILESRMPRLRAIQAVAVGLPLFLLLFASAYVVMAQNAPQSFSEKLSRTDALYFTVTVFATVGFGDIVPLSQVARIVTMIQMIMDLIAVGLVAKVVLGAVQVAVHRHQTEPAAPVSGAPGERAPGEHRPMAGEAADGRLETRGG
jgi:voltage-gated potassium channel